MRSAASTRLMITIRGCRVKAITLTMALSPSVNQNWRAVSGRVIKSKAYRVWLNSTICMNGVPVWAHEMIQTPVAVVIKMRLPRANADLDNRIKPILDILVLRCFILDDKQVESLNVCWGQPEGGACEVTITS